MSTIQKLFSNKSDEEVHGDFVKFSRGNFENRYLVNAKKQKDRMTIKTGPEFANYLVKNCLNEVKEKVKITGVIVATFSVEKEAGFPIERIKQFMGVKQAVVNTEVESSKVISLMEKFPKAFYALSFSTPSSDLKIKAKAPKSAKPSTGGDKEPVAEFCSIKTNNKEIIDDLLFDVGDFKEASIKHTLQINEIIIPKGITDPVQMREQAKRKGKIIRIIKTDGNETKKECAFEA